ncbi:MAG: hypothetical protein ACRCTA_01340, partial [Bacilli bacterium]
MDKYANLLLAILTYVISVNSTFPAFPVPNFRFTTFGAISFVAIALAIRLYAFAFLIGQYNSN